MRPGSLADISKLTPLTRSTCFTFDLNDIPTTTFHFKALPTRPLRSSKRRRSACDVDGEGCSPLQKKKRRLRLDLITSRLSRPYATPSTFIGSRGTSKAARWARLRRVGKISLRKAALVNWTRLRKATAKDIGGGAPPAVEVGTLTIKDGDGGVMPGTVVAKDASQSPPQRPLHYPPRRSLLGLADYEVFDHEGDPFDDEDWDDSDGDINSDFNIREPEDDWHNLDDGPFLDPNSLLFGLPQSSTTPIWSILADENNQKEISLATFHAVLPA